MPDAVLLIALQILPHLIVKEPYKVKYSYRHFIDQETGSEVHLSKVMGLRSDRIRLQNQMRP